MSYYLIPSLPPIKEAQMVTPQQESSSGLFCPPKKKGILKRRANFFQAFPTPTHFLWPERGGNPELPIH